MGEKAEATRGPWKWIKQFPANGWALVTDDPEQDGIVAEAMGNGIWFPNDGGEADAHLIAAAPDLLQMLERIVNAGGWYMSAVELEPDENGEDLEVEARKVLAKARGESNE